MMFWKLFRRFKKPKEMGQYQTLDEDAFEKLHVDYGLHSSFMYSEPWSREAYEGLYIHGTSSQYFTAPSYEEYLRLFEKYQYEIRRRKYWDDYYVSHFGELPAEVALREALTCSEPVSQESYMNNPAMKYFNPPSYEEYLRLFEKYKAKG